MELSANAGSLAGLLGGGAGAVTALGFAIVPQGDPLGPAGLDFVNYEGMKQFKGGICVNTYLSQGEKNLLNSADVSATQGEWNLKLNYKFTSPKGEPKGCVAVSWNKETWDDNKWKGAIRYEWLYTIGDETLVTYGLYTTEEDKSGTGIKWKTIYVNREKKTSDGLLWEELVTKPKFSREWPFTPDFDQICKASHECVGSHKEKSAGEVKWTWKEDKAEGGKKFSDWTTNFNNAFSSLITRLALNNQGSQFSQLIEKKGIWTRR